jgi:outer membrane protein TolC
MKFWLFFGVVIYGHLALAAVELNSTNLRSVLDEKNSVVAAAKLQASAAKERQGFFARSLFPSIGLFGAQESFKTGSRDTIHQPFFGAEASINLFNGGRDWNESLVREKKADQKQLEAIRVQAEELEKLRVLYWQALYLRDKIELIKADIKVNESNLNSAIRRIRSGVATESDRIEFEMHAITVKQELDETRLKYEGNIRDIAAMIGVEDPADIKLTEVLTHEHEYQALLQHTVDDHDFLFKEQELQSHINDLEARSSRYGWVPRVDAYATYHQYNQREIDVVDEAERRESTMGVKVSMNLGSVLESRREAAALRQEAVGLSRMAEQKKKEIHVHIDNELAELELLHNQVHLAEENITMAEKYYRMTQSEYARGVKNSPDVLGASAKLFEIRNKQLEIVRDFQISKAHILSKIGK